MMKVAIINCTVYIGLVLLLISLNIEIADTKMARGLGRYPAQRKKVKPWERNFRTNRRPWKNFDYDEDIDKDNYVDSPDELEPPTPTSCVGLCYYKKLLALEKKINETPKSSPRVETTIQVKVTTPVSDRMEEETKIPCIGICQYYRSLGIENPYPNFKRDIHD